MKQRKKMMIAAAVVGLALVLTGGIYLFLRLSDSRQVTNRVNPGVTFYTVPADASELTYDVVVVGEGPASLYASATVAENGGSVILLEKMPYVGGNILHSTGNLNAVDPMRQGQQGIEDSVELFIKNTYESGNKKGNLDLITILCENAYKARAWIEERGGKWNSHGVFLTGGGAWPRSLDVAASVGETYIRPLAQIITQNGGHIVNNAYVTDLIFQKGKTTGVQVLINNKPYSVYGGNGVVLATGGFGGNPEMVAQYGKNVPQGIPSESASAGEGILMAQKLNADLVDMEYIQLMPCVVDDSLYLTDDISGAIYINQKGERFVSEQENSNVVSEKILEQPGGTAYMIFDSNTIHEQFLDVSGRTREQIIRYCQDKGFGWGETVEELAAGLDVPADVLAQTIRDFNTYVEGASTDPTGRELFFAKLGDGPFFASKREPRIYHTTGGLRIDTDTRVIDKEGKVIPGLYACGEVTGGIHATNQVSGNALADCIVFGRIAGQNALNGL